jgi:peroxiredoxin
VKIAEEFAGRGVVLVAVSYDDTPEDARMFLEKNGYDCVVLMDNRISGVTGPLYQVGPIPTLFLIDASGTITYRHVGYEEGDEKELRAEIEKALGATAPGGLRAG